MEGSVQLKKIKADFFDSINKIVQFYRFDNITIGAEAVAFQNIFIMVRRSKYDNRNRFASIVGFDFFQYLQAIDLRKLKVEQNQS